MLELLLFLILLQSGPVPVSYITLWSNNSLLPSFIIFYHQRRWLTIGSSGRFCIPHSRAFKPQSLLPNKLSQRWTQIELTAGRHELGWRRRGAANDWRLLIIVSVTQSGWVGCFTALVIMVLEGYSRNNTVIFDRFYCEIFISFHLLGLQELGKNVLHHAFLLGTQCSHTC